jgi:chromosome segregation ATPase
MLYATDNELTTAQNELAKAKVELETYRKTLNEEPSYVKLKNESATLDNTVKGKEKELLDLIDTAIYKNPAYVGLMTKNSELDKINSEIEKAKIAAENTPDVQKLKKDATDLREKAKSKEDEARKVVKESLASNEKVKELLAKKSELANVPIQMTKFKKDAMDNPRVKLLQQSLASIKKEAATKHKALENATEAIKKDNKLNALEISIKELEQKVKALSRVQAETAGTKAMPAQKPK